MITFGPAKRQCRRSVVRFRTVRQGDGVAGAGGHSWPRCSGCQVGWSVLLTVGICLSVVRPRLGGGLFGVLTGSFVRGVGGRELPRYGGDHDTRGEQQPALEPQRRLVVQQLFPPVPDDVFRDEHGDDVPGLVLAYPPDVVEHRLGDLPERRIDDLQRHRDLPVLPFPGERRGVAGVDVDGDRLQQVGSGGPRIAQRPHRR